MTGHLRHDMSRPRPLNLSHSVNQHSNYLENHFIHTLPFARTDSIIRIVSNYYLLQWNTTWIQEVFVQLSVIWVHSGVLCRRGEGHLSGTGRQAIDTPLVWRYCSVPMNPTLPGRQYPITVTWRQQKSHRIDAVATCRDHTIYRPLQKVLASRRHI